LYSWLSIEDRAAAGLKEKVCVLFVFWRLFREHIFVINFLIALSLQAHAAGVTPVAADPLVKVTSMVQFVEGHAQKTETSGVKTELIFQTPLYEGDRADSNGVLKLAARNGCVFVLRGEGTAAAPVGTKPWRLRADSLRILCEGRASAETFGVANEPLVMKDGEILFAKKHILLVTGAATYRGQALQLRKLYNLDGALVTPQPSDAELREFNLTEAPPREAYEWPAPPKPDKIYTSRLSFGPFGGRTGLSYDNSDYNQSNIDTNGPRLQVHVKTSGGAATIFALSFRSTDNHNNGGMQDGVNNSLDSYLFEVGHRNEFDRWWSPYWRVGAGFTQAKIFYSKALSGGGYTGTGYRYEFYVLSASYGIDARFTPQFLRPFGAFASLEGQVIQSIARGGRSRENSGSQSTIEPTEPWRMTTVSGLASLGLEVQF